MVYFLSSLVASEQSVFPLIEVLVSKVSAILTKLDSREAQNSTSEAAILKLYLVARLCLRGIIPSYSTLAGLEKPATDFTSFPRPEKCFFSSDYVLHYLNYDHSFSEFGAFWAQKTQLKSSHNPEW